MIIQRDQYLSELLSKRWNGKVKIITGIRRCGSRNMRLTLLSILGAKRFIFSQH